MKVFVSWPKLKPELYWTLTHKMNAQISYNLLNRLKENYEVEWVDWQSMPKNFSKGDFFIRHTSMRQPDLDIVKDSCSKGLKIIFFTNSGNNYYTDDIKRCYSVIVKTNDITIDKWYNNDPETEKDLRSIVKKRNIDTTLIPHPVDKDKFNREVFNSYGKKYLVLGGNNKRKRANILRSLLKKYQYEIMTPVKWNIPSTYSHIVKDCSYVATYSKFEGFPYFLNEAAYKGLLPIGMEGYWHGYGHKEIVLKYNDTDEKNKSKLNFILNEDMEEIYKDVMKKHLSREDHTWEYAIKIITSKIEKFK